MTYQNAILELERLHLYPNIRQKSGSGEIVGLEVTSSPLTYDSKIEVIKQAIGEKDWNINWHPNNSWILIMTK